MYKNIPEDRRPDLRHSGVNLVAGNGTAVRVWGKCEIKINIESMDFTQTFIICEDTVIPILGRDFMKKYDLHLRLAEGVIKIGDKIIPGYTTDGVKTGKVKLNHFYIIQPDTERVLEAKTTQKFGDGTVGLVAPLQNFISKTGLVGCNIAAKYNEETVPFRIFNPGPDAISLKRGTVVGKFSPILSAKPYGNDAEKSSDLECTCTCGSECSKTQLDASNTNNTSYYGSEDINCCHKIMAVLPQDRYEAVFNTSCNGGGERTAMKPYSETDIPVHVRELYIESVKQLATPLQKQKLARMLVDYSDCFAKNSDDIGRTSLIKHDIDTGDEAPVKQRCRRFAKCHVEIIQQQVKKLAEAGLIKPSESEWASNCLVVKKKDGTWRLCIDYRALNLKTKNPDSYSLPRIDDTIDALGEAKYFCTLDLIQGYHQVELTERSKEKTAFHAPQVNPSHWEYKYMPFGLVRAPRTFQRLMDRVIRGLSHKIALAYLDDIIVYGASLDKTLENLELIFDRLRQANLKLKAKKCQLFATEVNYLGYVITSKGIKTDPKKIEAIKNWHPPVNVRTVRSFLGLVQYYSKFIRNFADVCRPLNNLTRKGVPFLWNADCQKSFDEIKEMMVSAPILAYPKNTGQFILDTDASAYAYGGVLSQMQANDVTGNLEERVIAYVSRNFTETERLYCARKRELFAITRLVKHFDVYLRGTSFVVRTDHASLQYIKTLKEMPLHFQRWIMQLEEYSYKIVIRKGALHGNADAMSRGCHGKECICIPVAKWEAVKRNNTSYYASDLQCYTNIECWDAKPYVNDGSDRPSPLPYVPQRDDEEQARMMRQLQIPVCETCVTDNHADATCVVAAFHLRPQYGMDDLASKQQEDPDISPVYNSFLESTVCPPYKTYSHTSPTTKAYYCEWTRLEMRNRVLYRRWESRNGLRNHLQVLLPRSMQWEVLEKIHDSQSVAHMGRRRTVFALQQFCHWYRLFEDVKWWIHTCEMCQRRKRPRPAVKAPMQLYKQGFPNERISMDIIGPLMDSERGNKYMLVIGDHFTKYTQVFPMKDQTAETVANKLVFGWFQYFGEPLELHTDRGTNFESNLIKEICKIYSIWKSRTTPYHPQADGMIERYNKTLEDNISKYGEKKNDWDEVGMLMTCAYNATVHETTGCTPNFLKFGHEVNNAATKLVPDPNNEALTTVEYARRLKRRLMEAYDIVRTELRKSAVTQKKYYDLKQHLVPYKVGQPCRMIDFSQPEKGEKKLRLIYTQLWWVVDVLSKVTFRIQRDEKTAPRIIHHDHMKPVKRREWTVTPDWVWRITKAKLPAIGTCDVTPDDNTSSCRNSDLVNPRDKNYQEPQPSTVPRRRQEKTTTTNEDTQALPQDRASRERYGSVELENPTTRKDLDTSENGPLETLVDRVKARKRQPRRFLDL